MRAERHLDLQELRHLTKQLLATMYESTQHMPYTIRLLAREALLALRVCQRYSNSAHAARSNTQMSTTRT